MARAGTLRIRLLTAALAVGAVAVLTLGPRALVAPARGRFMQLLDAVTAPIPVGEAERMLNTLMFVPLGVAIALLLSRRAWPVAILAGFALSAAVEYAQGSIPGRVPDPNDVLWNTVGAVIGVVALTLCRYVAAAMSRAAQRGRVTRT